MTRDIRGAARRCAALSATLILIGGLAACTGAAPTPSSAPSTDETRTPKATGPLDAYTWYGDYRAPYSLDPVRSADYPEATAVANLCDPLVRLTADYEMVPGIATSWTYTDASTLVFAVREGVTFTDGSPLTADDVAFSLRRNMDPDIGSSFAIAFQNVASIEATSTDEVTVTFSAPDASFLSAMPTGASGVVSRAFAEQAGADFGTPSGGILCSGPYSVEKFDGVSTLRLEKNPDYWDEATEVLADTVVFEYPANPQALGNALRGGEIDGGFNLPAQLVPSLRDGGGGTLWIGAEGSSPQSLAVVVSDLADGPLADPAVRAAFSASIDREGIAGTVYSGAADPLYTVASPGTWGYARDEFATAYQDVVDAAQTSEGLPDGADPGTVRLAYPAGDDTYSAVATILQQSAKKIGLDVEIEGIPLAQYGMLFIDPAAREPYDAFLTLNYIQVREPAFMYGMIASPGGVQNYGGYDDPDVSGLLEAAFRTIDDDERAALVIEAQKKISADLPWIPIVAMRAISYTSDRVTGIPLTFSFMGQPWAAAVGSR